MKHQDKRLAMIKEIDELLMKSSSKTSILIKEVDTERVWYEKDSTAQVVSASIIKVPIMLGVLDLVVRRVIRLEDTIRIDKEDILTDDSIGSPGDYTIEELVTQMIITSDNTATNALLRAYGIDYFNTYLRNVLKVRNTRIERYMLDYKAVAAGHNNYTSNLDMYKIFKKLYHHEVLDDDMCHLAKKILLHQQDCNHLLSGVAEGCAFAHKTGELDYLHHDVGVLSSNQDYYIGIFTWDTADIQGDKDLMGDIGKAIFDGLDKI